MVQQSEKIIFKFENVTKLFTICTTNSYIVDVLGLFHVNQNDPEIMKLVMQNGMRLTTIMKPDDIFVVDRIFRDSMITKVRWVVNAMHDMIEQKTIAQQFK